MKALGHIAVLALFIGLVACSEEKAMHKTAPAGGDFDAVWNYNAPVKTREAFTQILKDAGEGASLAWTLELETQIARTHSLVGEFDEAHALLDGVDAKLTEDMTRAHIRYLLERGRAYNSAGNKARARALFLEAWEQGKTAGEDFHAVDAAHMVAITEDDPAEVKHWNLVGLDYARGSDSERARGWVGSLTNNLGWGAFDAGNLDGALALFEESRDSFLSRKIPARARIARWSIARVKREQGKLDEALAIQLEIGKENEAAGEPDGYNFEELAELWLLKNEPDKAAPNFARAYELLSQDAWFAKSEPERLARLKALSLNRGWP